MAFDPTKISDIKSSAEGIKGAESGIGSNPLTRGSSLSGAENAKPEGTSESTPHSSGSKAKAGMKGAISNDLKEKAAVAKIASQAAAQNYGKAAWETLKNRKAVMSQSKKALYALILGVVVAFALMALIFYTLFIATGSALKSVMTAVQKATGVYYVVGTYKTTTRIISSGWHGLFGANTTPPKTKLGQELASLDVAGSLQKFAYMGNNRASRAPPNTSFASTGLLSRLASFADLKSSTKSLDTTKAAKTLDSTIKYEGNKVIINGAPVELPPANPSPAQLKSFYSNMESVLRMTDPFKFYASVPQLASFNKTIRQQYKIPQEAWANKGLSYDGMSDADSFKKIQQDTHNIVSANNTTRQSTLPFVNKLQNEIQANLQKALSDGNLDPSVVAQNSINQFIIDQVFKANDLDSTSLAGYSLCLVNDMDLGAKQSTASMIPSSIRQAAGMAAAADQTVSGDLQGNELGANLNLYGDMYNQGNYQRTVFNSDWANAKSYTQQPQSGYQQLLNQSPPTGMIGALKAFLKKVADKDSSMVYSLLLEDKQIVKEFMTDENAPCGSGSSDIHDVVNPSVNIGGLIGNIPFFGDWFGDNAKNKLVARINDFGEIISQYITSDSNIGLTALSMIPGSTFSSSVKLGFGYLLKSTIMNNMGLNYAGISNDNYTNQVVSGFSMLGNEESRKMGYGRPLQLGEVKQINDKQLADHKAEMSHMSVLARMTDLNSPYSLASQMAVASTGWRNNTLNKVVGSIGHSLSFISQPAKVLASTGSVALNSNSVTRDDVAYAADDPTAYVTGNFPDSNAGNIQWGWSQAEMDKVQSDSSYSLENNAAIVEPRLTELDKTWGPCFEGDVTTIVTDLDQPAIPAIGTQPGTPAHTGLLTRCLDMKDNDDALRYRLYKSDETMIADLKDLETVTQDVSNSSSSSVAGTTIDMADLTKDSTNVACAPNTSDLGIQDGYSGGNLVKIKACAVPNLPSTGQESQSITGASSKAIVNSRVSGAVYAMVEAAKKDGINLSATSSFRTMVHQQQLYSAYKAGKGNLAATPGTSNHQMGLAIDFNTGNGAFEWLQKNAAKYGYKNLPSEAWHWSPTGN